MVKQKNIVIKTASAVLTYAEMGEVVVSSTALVQITLPAPHAGLWYRIHNVNSGEVKILFKAIEIASLSAMEHCMVMAEGTTNWYLSLGGSSEGYTLPQATETALGGVKAKAKTTESAEVAIDPTTGKLYGPASKDELYTHDQLSSSLEWNITHPLNRFPSVTVVDSGGTVVVGDVTYISPTQIKLTFSAEFSGKAYLN